MDVEATEAWNAIYLYEDFANYDKANAIRIMSVCGIGVLHPYIPVPTEPKIQYSKVK